MNELFPITVECYSGYKTDEYPVKFYLDDIGLNIIEIIDRWYQISASSPKDHQEKHFTPANYFKVRTSDQKIYLLKQEIESGDWFVLVKGESINLNHSHR